MANNQITMTQREKWALEGKAKQGWKCYFIEREYAYNLADLRTAQRPMVENLRRGEAVDLTHLSQMFLELYDKVGELCDCPVCYEQLTKENTKVPVCGHLVCLTCKERMTECPICKKKY
jgi:hypothetical protein